MCVICFVQWSSYTFLVCCLNRNIVRDLNSVLNGKVPELRGKHVFDWVVISDVTYVPPI